jgi:hypothetical protein
VQTDLVAHLQAIGSSRDRPVQSAERSVVGDGSGTDAAAPKAAAPPAVRTGPEKLCTLELVSQK